MKLCTWATGVKCAWLDPFVLLVSPYKLFNAGPSHALHETALHLQGYTQS